MKTIPKKFTPLSEKQKDGVAKMMAQGRAREQFEALGSTDISPLGKAISQRMKKKLQ